MTRRLALPVALIVLLAGAAVVWAQASERVRQRDTRGDVGAPPDIQSASVERAPDGQLRAAITFTQVLRPADLLARSGPPGSVCLRIWSEPADESEPAVDPAAQRPDRLVCVTARSEEDLRASIYEQPDAGLPRRTGSATVRRNRSGRSLLLRVAQSRIGRPERIRFTVEASRAGCASPECIDTLPAAPRTLRFRLR